MNTIQTRNLSGRFAGIEIENVYLVSMRHV
jgi:hypothetical protein